MKRTLIGDGKIELIDKPWDSELFGLKACELKINTADRLLIESTLNFDVFLKLKYEHVLVRVPSAEIDVVQILEGLGFVTVDGYLNFTYNLARDRCPEFDMYCVRPATADDLDELIGITQQAYQKDRYHCDPFLDKGTADRVYRTWIENSVLGLYDTRVDVVDWGVYIAGFSTCRLGENKCGFVGLTAVRNVVSGMGVGKDLLKANLRYFFDNGMGTVEVGTQLSNIAAIRLYNSVGFKVMETFVTLVRGV